MDEVLAASAERLANLGYHPVPVPAGQKGPPAAGFTGSKHQARTFDQWFAYVEANPDYSNLAMRLPEGVVGVDIDGYKIEGAESAAMIKSLMPRTVVISARHRTDADLDDYAWDGISGIYLYRSSLNRGGLPGVDIIRYGHRYAMAPGSVHPSGRTYQALDMRTGEYALCDITDLPDMPAALAAALTHAEVSTYTGPTTKILDKGEACNYNQQMLIQFKEMDWDSAGSRHAEMLRLTRSVVLGQGDGHVGAERTLLTMLDVWTSRLGEARADEFKRAVRSLPFPVLGPDDPCDNYFDVLGLTPDTPGITWVGPPPPGYKAAEVEQTDEPEGFWSSRTWLAWCAHEASRLGHGPWAFVGAALAWTAATIAPEVTVDMGKGPVSLNTFCMLVGPPSSGKSLAFNAVEEAHDWGLIPTGVGTGEGVARAFVRRVTGTDEITKQKVNRVEQHSFRAILFEDEWGRMVSVSKSRGGTIDAVLRTAWMSGHLGQANRSDETTLPVRKHSYRLAIVAGSQIEPAMDILSNDATGLGTSQRWLLFQARKAEQVEGLAAKPFPAWPLPERFTRDSALMRTSILGDAEVRFKFNEYQAEEYDNPGREHQALRTIKIAALVALLEGRTEIEGDDWNLALRIDAHSTRMKNRLMEDAAAAQREKNVQKKAAALSEEAQAASIVERQEVVRLAITVYNRVVKEPGVTWSKIKDSQLKRWKNGPKDEPVDYALSQGWITEGSKDSANGKPGRVFFPGPNQPPR